MTTNIGISAIRSLDYIFVLCDDLNKMKCFFVDVFDFRIEEEDEGQYVVFRAGNLFLGLRSRGRKYDGPQIPGKSASIQLSFRVPPADVDIAYQTLNAKGVDVIEAPTNQDFTHRTLFFHDPENNIIEIYADIHTDETVSVSSGVHRV